MSNSKLAPEVIEPPDSLDAYGTYPWYPSNQAGSSNVWEFSIGELYGCVCHRPIDELARSPIASNAVQRPTAQRAGAEEGILASAVAERPGECRDWHVWSCIRSIAAMDRLLNG